MICAANHIVHQGQIFQPAEIVRDFIVPLSCSATGLTTSNIEYSTPKQATNNGRMMKQATGINQNATITWSIENMNSPRSQLE